MTYPLFFDIETVPMSTEEKPMTDEQIKKTIEKYGEKLNFMPEFNKILVISYGVVEGSEFVIKSITGDEHDIITVFFHVLDTYKEGNIQLIGHNIKGFDIPFIAKRAMYNGIKIHPMLKAFGKKPWEIDYILDTCEVYKHFSFWSFASLDLVTEFLGISNPKDAGIDGSMVSQFHEEWKDDEIIKYCERDVKAVAQLYKKFKTLNLI